MGNTESDWLKEGQEDVKPSGQSSETDAWQDPRTTDPIYIRCKELWRGYTKGYITFQEFSDLIAELNEQKPEGVKEMIDFFEGKEI